MKKSQLLFISLLVLSIVLRFLWLDRVPSAVGGDELTYLLTAKSVALWGKDLTGSWSLLQALVFKYPPGYLQAELPYFLLIPVVGFAEFSLFNARIIYALLSVGIVVLIFKIASQLFDRTTGFAAGFLAAINPWMIFLGRTNYEMLPATFFYLWGFYFLLVAKGRKVLFSLVLFILAFYSYIGTKVILLPFVLLTVLYLIKNRRKYLKEYLFVLTGCVLISILFFLAVKSNSRMGEFVLPNAGFITEQVDISRKNSINTPLTSLFENKYIFYGEYIVGKVFNALSPTYLFFSGDNFFGLWDHGFFYIIDLIFLIIGAGFLFKRRIRLFFLLSLLILLGLAPQVFHVVRENFSPHITLIFPFMLLIMAVGIVGIIKYSRYFLPVIIFLYLISLANFINIYFFKFPLSGQFDFSMRVLSRYVDLSKKDQKIIVYSSDMPSPFQKHLFYANALNKNTITEVEKAIKYKKYSLERITFSSCEKDYDFKNDTTYIIDSKCGEQSRSEAWLNIPRLKDGGAEYRIYNDKLCARYALKKYPTNMTLSDFDIERMQENIFCETFITN